MAEFGIYMLESSLCMAGFYLVYRFLLAQDTFATRNRVYLLLSTLVSLLIPLMSFSLNKEVVTITNQFVWELENSFQNEFIQINEVEMQTTSFSFLSLLIGLYFTGFSIALLRLIKHVFHLVKLIQANEIKIIDGFKIVSINENSSPYSFFGYIFLNPQSMTQSEQNHVLLHESIHARQVHSLDLIFVELIKALLWFNPFIYLIKRSLIEMHEYLADRECLKEGIDEISYQTALLKNVESQMMFALTSSFNSSLTLKRIKMIKKINTSQFANLKLLLVIPVILISLLSFSFTETPESLIEGNFDTYYPSNDIVFPIKAGNKIFISAGYGERIHPISKKKIFHKGMDIAAPKGTAIVAVWSGVVRKVKVNFEQGKSYGRFIIVDHENGMSSLYSQMESYAVKEGQKISKGDVIGTVGSSGMSTGPHLHFELKKEGKHVNPRDYFKMDLSAYKR